MAKRERGFFDADQSHISGRESYESLFGMDPALLTPSAFFNVNPNTNEDLNDILGGSNFDGNFEYGSGMDTGYNTWGAQGNTYNPYPNFQTDQHQYGPSSSTGAISSGLEQNFPQHGTKLQAVSYSDIYTSSRMSTGQERAPTSTSDQTLKTAKSAAKRKPDNASTATATATDGTTSKVKKSRGRRKTKEKSAEEKRAKEERKLERNRMAASKCRQKKKLATEEMMGSFNELERQNQFIKACLEEVKQDRNKVLALLLEHKGCGNVSVDKCLEIQLERIAGEFEENQRTDSTMLELLSLESQADQFLNSSPTSPSDTITSRRNSISVDSIAMSRSGSTSSPDASPRISTTASARKQSPHASQAQAQAHFATGYQSWQDQFSMPPGQQDRSMPESKASHQRHTNSPPSCSSPGVPMSRPNSSRSSICDDHQRIDSGISNVDTPPEERKKNMSDSPEDEAISLVASKNTFQSRAPHMMPNQRLFGKPNLHSAMKQAASPSDLKNPSSFVASLTKTSL